MLFDLFIYLFFFFAISGSSAGEVADFLPGTCSFSLLAQHHVCSLQVHIKDELMNESESAGNIKKSVC